MGVATIASKYTNCDNYRPYHLIQSTVRPAFRQIGQICCAYELLRCLDVEIRQLFFVDDNDDNDKNRLLYPLHVHRVITRAITQV